MVVAGILLMLTGRWLGRRLRSGEKFAERKLERAHDASFTEGLSLFLSNPGVTFPVSLIFFGVLLIICGVIFTVAAIIG